MQKFAPVGIALLVTCIALGLLVSIKSKSRTEAKAEVTQAPIQNALKLQVEETQQPEQYASQQIMELPDDSGVWYLTFILPENYKADATSRRLLATFAGDSRLRSLQAQCKVYHFTPSDPRFSSGWRNSVDMQNLPAVFLQQPSGNTCYKVSGNNIPTSNQLADDISTSIDGCRGLIFRRINRRVNVTVDRRVEPPYAIPWRDDHLNVYHAPPTIPQPPAQPPQPPTIPDTRTTGTDETDDEAKMIILTLAAGLGAIFAFITIRQKCGEGNM